MPEVDPDTALTDALIDSLTGFYRDRKVVLVGAPLSQHTEGVAALRRYGSRSPFVVANGLGTGSPPRDIAGYCEVAINMASPTGFARGTERLLIDPPRHVRRALDAYDADREALVIAGPAAPVSEMDGRKIADAQRTAWADFEDPTRIDDLMDELGIRRAPSSVVPAEPDAIAAAVARHDLGHGVLCVGDISGGPHLAMEFARWLHDSTDTGPAAAWFAGRCAQVRISPLVPGVPCGVNGLVLPDGVVVLRPYEDVLLFGGEQPYLVGCSTYLRLGTEDEMALRDLATRVGAELARRADFRGAFQLSGVAGRSGFLASAVGTRFGTAHSLMAAQIPDVSLQLLHTALVAGHEPAVAAADLQDLLWRRVTDRPAAVVAIATRTAPATDGQTLWLRRDGGRLRPALSGERSDGCLVNVALARGGKVLVVAGPTFGQGAGPLAPVVAEALTVADEQWGTAWGPLVPASTVR